MSARRYPRAEQKKRGSRSGNPKSFDDESFQGDFDGRSK
jgi:hypothetical protein